MAWTTNWHGLGRKIAGYDANRLLDTPTDDLVPYFVEKYHLEVPTLDKDQAFVDRHRMRSMMDALRRLHVPNSMGAALFFFATRNELPAADPLTHPWQDGHGRSSSLI